MDMDHYTLESLPPPDAKKQRLTRILLFVWLGLGVVIALMLCYIVYGAFRPAPPSPVLINDVDVFPPDSISKAFVNADFFDETSGKTVQTLPLAVVRDANGNFTVFFARSTRTQEAVLSPQQCVVEWDDSLQKFLELCGGSVWTRDGKYSAGPAPRDLDRFPAHVENGKLYLELKLIPGAPHS